jgi:hypothetical protein
MLFSFIILHGSHNFEKSGIRSGQRCQGKEMNVEKIGIQVEILAKVKIMNGRHKITST